MDFRELAPGACEAGTFNPKQCVTVGGDYNLDGVNNARPDAVKDHVNATLAQWADGFKLPANFLGVGYDRVIYEGATWLGFG